MTDQYEILNVDSTWRRDREQMGSKKKFWYLPPEDGGHFWLFKYPKPNTGEHWAEKISAEVAGLLKVLRARVELAVFEGQHGSATESFTHDGWELWHGNQLLEEKIQGYDSREKFHQSSHTLKNIWNALDFVFTKKSAAKKAKLRVAEYIILDALIGNTDRHHENWGILRQRVRRDGPGEIAPSFDHASSLGRELLDQRRKMLLDEDRVGHYAERGRGGIYWSESDTHAPCALELARRAATAYPHLFRPILGRLQALNEQLIMSIICRVPKGWMSPLARRFASRLMSYNLNELRKLNP